MNVINDTAFISGYYDKAIMNNPDEMQDGQIIFH